MRSQSLLRRCALAMWSVLGLLASGKASAVTLMQPGYNQSAFLSPAPYATGLKVGGDGTVYLFRITSGTDGIRKVTSGGVETPWSTAIVRDLAILPSGGAIGAGLSCNCLVRIEPDGSYATFAQDSINWDRVAVGPDGTIYAAGSLNGGARLYQIDPLTEQRTLVASASLFSEFGSLEFGADGRLYAIKYSTWPERILARLDGSQFVQVTVLPYGGDGLARGADGILWMRTAYDYGSGYPTGEIWAVDSATGSTTLLARVGWADRQFWGVGYDPGTSRLYVGEPTHNLLQPLPVVRAVTDGLLPARSVSWGSVKARYDDAHEGGHSNGR